MRLIASAASPTEGLYDAAVEIQLDPDVITYWRSPGDAGAPPVFSFEGSENIAGVTVLYPAPTRIDEGGAQAFGYRGHVTFPLNVTLKDETRPAKLTLILNYAVCGLICMPAKAAATLALPSPTRAIGAAPPEEITIAMARARVPVQLSAAKRETKVKIERDAGTAAPTWRLTWQSGEVQDLFVEAPEQWYFETRKSDHPNEFLIVEVEKPKTESAALVPVILTLTQAQQAYEFEADLDAASIKP